MIVEGETGWIFESRSVPELADVLRQVAKAEPHELQRRGRTARRMVEERFSRAVYLERILDLYASLGVRQAERLTRAAGWEQHGLPSGGCRSP